MKKILSILLVFVCLLSVLTGCGENPNKGNNNATTTSPSESIPEQTEPVELSFIYDLEDFDVENLKEVTEKIHLTYQTKYDAGTAHLYFETEDFVLRGCENESNAIIFTKEGEAVAKICIEADRYYKEEFLEEADRLDSDRNYNWSHYLLIVNGETYGHVAEYVHGHYGSLHITCKNIETLDRIIATLNTNTWSGGHWSAHIG